MSTGLALRVSNLHGVQCIVHVDPETETVNDLRAKICRAMGFGEQEELMLVSAGKYLRDPAQPLALCGLRNNQAVVYTRSSPVPGQSSTSTISRERTRTRPEATSATASAGPNGSAPRAAIQQAFIAAPQAAQVTIQEPNAADIQTITSLGFSEDLARDALLIAQGVQQAADLLFGMDHSRIQAHAAQLRSRAQRQSHPNRTSGDSDAENSAGQALQMALAGAPPQQLLNLIRQTMLGRLTGFDAGHTPDRPDRRTSPASVASDQSNPVSDSSERPRSSAAAGSSDVIALTSAELEEVQRISNMGYSFEDVLQAYIACDKDADRTVNLLREMF